MRISKYLTLFLSVFLVPSLLSAANLNVSPEKPIQGEPVMISVYATSTVDEIYFESKKLGVFVWKGMPTAIYGIDLYKTPGTYRITAKLGSGEILEKKIEVVKRPKEEAPLGIPGKLGGNTATSAAKLVSTLTQENASLLGLRTGNHAFWTKPFVFPVANPTVTDTYGYQRQTVGYSIAHKGTDFRAVEGTPVLAMNRGVVRLTQNGRNYGNTIILDHGLGLQTFYMHLSKIKVKEGELVLPGQVIGLSGQTGYAERAHLHLTIRLNEVSIDPMKFMAFFGK
jgi:murein DD-endopeptidase MepM/ murein hydrolase activator NlpD